MILCSYEFYYKCPMREIKIIIVLITTYLKEQHNLQYSNCVFVNELPLYAGVYQLIVFLFLIILYIVKLKVAHTIIIFQ